MKHFQQPQLYFIGLILLIFIHACKDSPTCYDGVENGDETGIDCGGDCRTCRTCFDGIKNQDETDVDCGGVCVECGDCANGVQDGSEKWVDCGGSCDDCTYIPGDGVTDIDGNYYETIKVDGEEWMAENLKVTHLNSGDEIPYTADNSSWAGASTPAYCWYQNSSSNKSTFGALYNGYTVNTDSLCPAGWHVPTVNEWEALIEHLGGDSIAGGKMKATGTTYWNSPNTGATNESNFTALPGGYRDASGNFQDFSFYAFWWSSGESGHFLYYNNDNTNAYYNDIDKANGYSVRCVRD